MIAQALVIVVLLLLGSGSAQAGQVSDNSVAGGLRVTQDLRHRIVVPQIIYFRIGSAGFGDRTEVRFDVPPTAAAGNNQTYSGVPVPPLGSGDPVPASSNGVLPVEVIGNVGTLTLTYELSNAAGLQDGAGNSIPFDDFNLDSTDPVGLPAPPLATGGGGGAVSVAVPGNLFSGRVVRRSADWSIEYANSRVLRAGTYTGSVQYTISAP